MTPRNSVEDVTEFVLDGTHGSPERIPTGIPVLSAQNVRGGRLNWDTDRFTSTAEYESFNRRLSLRQGDVLLTIVGSIGRTAVVDEVRPVVFQRSVAILRPKSKKLDSSYLRHVIESDDFQSQLERATNQSSQAGVYLGKLKKLSLPIPSMEEQRKIAAILDQAETLRAKRRQTLAKLDTLTQSLFLEMFGDPTLPSPHWPIASLDESIEMLQYGPRFYNESYAESGVRIARITDLDESGRLDYSQMPKLKVSEVDYQKYALQPGEIIFARTGATVGKVSVVREGAPPCIAGAYFIRMRFRSDRFTPDYVYATLASRPVQAIIARQSRQAAQQNFSGPALRRLPLPLAPLSRQREFSRGLRRIEKLQNAPKLSEGTFTRLVQSLKHRAFRGEL